MKSYFFSVVAACLLSLPVNAAVLRLSTSNSDANAGNSLNLVGVGSSGSMYVWVSTTAGQTITGLSTSILSSDAAVLQGTAHITANPNNRWNDLVGNGVLGDLVTDTNAFALFGQTGINTLNENTFVLHSEIQFMATGLGTTNLGIVRGAFDIVEGAGYVRIPDSNITFGTGIVSVSNVPEPNSLALFGVTLAGMVCFGRRR